MWKENWPYKTIKVNSWNLNNNNLFLWLVTATKIDINEIWSSHLIQHWLGQCMEVLMWPQLILSCAAFVDRYSKRKRPHSNHRWKYSPGMDEYSCSHFQVMLYLPSSWCYEAHEYMYTVHAYVRLLTANKKRCVHESKF